MSRKERRARQRWLNEWLPSAQNGTTLLRLALDSWKRGEHDRALALAKMARKDFRWARWWGFTRHAAP